MKKVQVEPFYVAGLAIRTHNTDGQALKDIQALWGRFFNEQVASKVPGKISDDVYSVYCEYESDHTGAYTTLLGVRVNGLPAELPEGFRALAFEGGTYTIYTAKGNIHEGIIGQTWEHIWNTAQDRRFTADFEVYGPRSADTANAEVDIYIAIK
ncbi:MAG: AraC family transcriptional regulator [Bacteroidia bacterium]|nr:AraC family transcriptional regulator [Bacteroidia bacterium]